MTKTFIDLEREIAETRKKLEEKAGHLVTSSVNGPIGIGLIQTVYEAIATTNQRIGALEQRVRELEDKTKR